MCGTSEVFSKHGEWSGGMIDRMKEEKDKWYYLEA